MPHCNRRRQLSCYTPHRNIPSRTNTVDYTPRQRYHARRKVLAARRRRLAAIGMAGLLAISAIAWLVWPRTGTPTKISPFVAAPTSGAVVAASGGAAAPPLIGGQALPVRASGPARFFDDQRLTYESDFYVPQVQAFLDTQPGPLKAFNAPVGNRSHSFAEIIVGQCLYYSVNPKLVLALLESQSSLLSTAAPAQNQLDWALGYHGADDKEAAKVKGLTAQVRWAVRQIVHARRDNVTRPPLSYVDKSTADAPAAWEQAEYVLARVLAPTTGGDQLEARMQAFAAVYTRLFGDPRPAPDGMPPPAAPFLSWPLAHAARITSFFDHDGPFLSQNGGTFSYWGRNERDLSYDGHDGWDYAAAPPDAALAAAAGTVIFAGNADDNCATTAVVIDHGNGYRTLYWHLSAVAVQNGQQVAAHAQIGTVGASGCALGSHLHFGVQYLGRSTDPYGYCGSVPDPWAQNPAGTTSTWLWRDRPSPCGPAPAGAIIVDTSAPGFLKTGDWQEAPIGYGGGALYARSVGSALPSATPPDATPAATATAAVTATARYQPDLPAGRYRLLAYIPYVLNGLDDGVGVTYHIRHSGGTTDVIADLQQSANEWLDLGTYDFAPGHADVTFDNHLLVGDQSVWADAIMWLPAP